MARRMMHGDLDLKDCRCVKCGSGALQRSDQTSLRQNEDIVLGLVECTDCGAQYDSLWGTVFFGDYEQADILSMIEIAFHASGPISGQDRAGFENLERILNGYHQAPDRAAFLDDPANSYAKEDWFPHRYTEWLQFTLLTQDIDLTGRTVLDVGAGSGFDSFRIFKAGARVTALDSNPILIRYGRRLLPEARWIGGFSHFLPFADGSFDIVCANAALHHMRDVSAAIEEMVRVLKPNGMLIIPGDPYRANRLGGDHELKIFNNHDGVLGGINEGIPTFGSIVDPIANKFPRVHGQILTSKVWNLPNPHGSGWINVEGMACWDLIRDRCLLAETSGSMSLRAVLTGPKVRGPALQRTSILRCGEFANWLDSETHAVCKLAKLLSPEYVNIPFPFASQTKFNLMNGWQARKKSDAVERTRKLLGNRLLSVLRSVIGRRLADALDRRTLSGTSDYQPAYRRARWFLTRQRNDSILSFQVRIVAPNPRRVVTFAVFLNAVLARKLEIKREHWCDVNVPLNMVPVGSVYCCEIQNWPDARPPETNGYRNSLLDDFKFQVRNRLIG